MVPRVQIIEENTAGGSVNNSFGKANIGFPFSDKRKYTMVIFTSFFY